MLQKIRFMLIKWLAGKDAVAINVHFSGTLIQGKGAGFYLNCRPCAAQPTILVPGEF